MTLIFNRRASMDSDILDAVDSSGSQKEKHLGFLEVCFASFSLLLIACFPIGF